MKFVIRDDDLNYFSKPEDIERWYTDIFTQAIPVGFSAIPFLVVGEDKWPIPIPSLDEEYSIANNKELVTYIRDNSMVEIMQHGTTHGTKNGMFEYQKTFGLFADTKRGKEELERTFGIPIKIFVPPHDWIGSHGVLAVEASDMDIIRGRGAGLRNWIPRWSYVRIFFCMLWFKFAHMLRGRILAYPYVLDFGLHKEACSYRLEDTDVFEGLAYAHEKNGVFVVVTHLHFYTDEKKERLLRIVEKARAYGAEFVRPSELFTQRSFLPQSR